MEAVHPWIEHNDLEKIVRRFAISTTVKFCSAPQKICHFIIYMGPRAGFQ